MRILIYIGFVSQTVFYIGYVCFYTVYLYKCTSSTPMRPRFCSQDFVFTLVQNVYNVASDFYILSLPIAQVAKLNMQYRKKIGVMAIFFVGFM